MLFFRSGKLYLTKGDSGAIKIKLKHNDGSPYQMAAGDKLTFTTRRTVGGPITMEVQSFTDTIDFVPTKTKLLDVGDNVFDIQLTTSAGDIFTVIGPTSSIMTNMVVLPEVTV